MSPIGLQRKRGGTGTRLYRQWLVLQANVDISHKSVSLNKLAAKGKKMGTHFVPAIMEQLLIVAIEAT